MNKNDKDIIDNLHTGMGRDEFEQTAIQILEKAVSKSKLIRDTLRKLEKEVAEKEEKIRNYQDTFQEMQTQLIKIQSEVYAKGTT